ADDMGAGLVDATGQDHGVARAEERNFLNYAAGNWPDVGAAMAADFCLVAHPAETDPHEFATQRVSDRLAETGFADAGRSEKTEDSTVSLRIEFAHGEIFDQPFLSLFKIVVIAIENLLCLIEIEVILAKFVPRQIGNDLDVTDDHGKLGACWRNEIESLQFALGLLHHGFRRIRFLQSRPQLLRLFLAATLGLTQLVLDRLELRTQICATLCVGKLRSDIFLQSLLDLCNLEL